MFGHKIPKGRVLLEGRVPLAWIAGVILALGIVCAVAVIGLSAAYTNSRCEVCHIIKPEVVTYQKTAHYRAGVSCQQCHTKPGVLNYVIRNLQGANNVFLYVSNTYQRPITTFVGTNNCVQCHPKSEIEKDHVVGNIRVNHKGLREAGYQCITCHANISHPGTQLAVARTSQNKMPICARCHDGKKLPDTCSTCHVGGAPAEEIECAHRGARDRRAVPGVSPEQDVLRRLPPRAGDAAPHTLEPDSRPSGRRPGQDHLRVVPPREDPCSASAATGCRCLTPPAGPAVTAPTRWTTRRSASSATAETAASSATACRCRTPPAGSARTPSTATASPGLCTKCRSRALYRLSRGRAATRQRLRRRPPEPRVQQRQRLHEVPRQRGHGAAGLLGRPVSHRLHQLTTAARAATGSLT